VLAEISERRRCRAEQRRSRWRYDDLPTVTARGDSRGAVHLEADVSIARDECLARVEPDANAQPRRGQGALDAGGTIRRGGRRSERAEKGVALRVDLHSAVVGDRRAHDCVMPAQLVRVRLGSELGKQARGALDIREEEGDRPCRKRLRHEPQRTTLRASREESTGRRAGMRP